ncbi:unnamed protein product [Peniophora sp. CBMAI 1063]|nr:unnamed protein product [Peniophora sp. CBMAI 1063]
MPVTFRPASHIAKSIADAKQVTARELLLNCSPDAEQHCDEILQSFLGRGSSAKGTILSPNSFRLQSMRHGLVQTVCEAYLEHRALVLRPDDVWLAILTQFSLYVNEHAEELRDKFVAHEGKQEITVPSDGIRHTVEFGNMAHRMTREMNKFIVDRAVRDWILPRFSTTTENDTVVASVVMMATMKAYFEYSFDITCGIPVVVLEGKRADWQDILRRARKLMEYGEETEAWYALLRPVLDRFVRSFDSPGAKENLEFWNHAVLDEWYNSPAGSNEVEKQSIHSALSNTTTIGGSALEYHGSQSFGVLQLDGMTYHQLLSDTIPPSIVEVDVKVIDGNGIFPSVMVAGIVGASVLDSGSTEVSLTGVKDTIAPAAGWWLYTKKGADRENLDALLSRMPQEKGGEGICNPRHKPSARAEEKDSDNRRSKASSMRNWGRRVLSCLPL